MKKLNLLLVLLIMGGFCVGQTFSSSVNVDDKELGSFVSQRKSTLRVDVAALADVAEKKGFGYKYGNLLELKKLTAWCNQHVVDPIKVQVPEFVGISSDRVVAMLVLVDFDIKLRWAAVVEKLPTKAEQDIAFKEKKIPDTFWEAQKIFITDLCTAFAKLMKLNMNDVFIPQELKEIENLFNLSQADALMVRSTGKEDTRTMANAGGNESVANVAPTMAAVLRAAERVVVSYFSEKSLNQRLGLGDKTLFLPDVFCPVLIQRMIGERQGGEISRCGVMFTEEAEGGISYKNEVDSDGRVKTTGITMIQAAYGHNEGVVNSRVVVDSYIVQMIDGKPVFYPTIRAKRSRLVPVSEKSTEALDPVQQSAVEEGVVTTLVQRTELRMRNNSQRLALAPVLNREMLTQLKNFAIALELYYGYPMDVEFVIRDGVLWIVQARPIVHKSERKDCHEAYFADLKSFTQGALFKGRTIGAFGGAIVEVLSPEECIISDRIGSALDTYLKSDRTVKCIFSGTDAPVTSHEATTFRSEGKPVLYVRDIVGLRAAFTDSKKLIFSPQQHCVAVVDAANNVVFDSVYSSGENIKITAGWCAYPVPKEVSILSVILGLLEGDDEISIQKDRLAGTSTEKLASLSPFFEQIKHKDATLALQAVQKISDIVVESVFRKLRAVAPSKDLYNQARLVVRSVRELCRRIEVLCVKNVPLLERLLAVNYLEAVVYQQIFGEKELCYLSVATLTKMLDQEKIDMAATIALGSEKTKSMHAQLKKVSNVIFDSESQAAWDTLINTLAQDKNSQHVRTLGLVVATLQSLDILPLWLHSTMVTEVKKLGATPTLKQCIDFTKQSAQAIQSSEKAFNLVKQLKQRVATFNIGRFAHHEVFDSTWVEFHALLMQFLDPSFTRIITNISSISSIDPGNKLVGIAASSLMAKFVEVFDLSIKALTGIKRSTLDGQVHAERFQKMLKQYYALLDFWVKLLPQPVLVDQDHVETFKASLNLMNELVSKDFSKTDLDPTQGIDLANYTLGCGFLWHRYLSGRPKTGEDVYAIIHQSLLYFCSKILLYSGGQELIETAKNRFALIRVIQNTVAKGFVGRSVDLIAFNIDSKKVESVYNIQLGHHSLQCIYQYSFKTKTVVAEFNFAGGRLNQAFRWRDTAAFFVLYKMTGMLNVIVKKLSTHNLSVVISDIKDDKLAVLKSIFSECPSLVEESLDTSRLKDAVESFMENYVNFTIELLQRGKALLQYCGSLGQDAALILEVILLKAMIERGLLDVFEVATETSNVALNNLAVDIKESGKDLLLLLVKKGNKQAFSVAFTQAKILVNREKKRDRVLGLDLLYNLVNKDDMSVVNEAFSQAMLAIKRTNLEEKKYGLDLLTLLIKFCKGPCLIEIFDVAVATINWKNPLIVVSCLYILEELLENKYEVDVSQVSDAAMHALIHQNDGVRIAGLRLFCSLNKKVFVHATAAQLRELKNSSSEVNEEVNKALEYYNDLMRRQKELSRT